MNKIDAQSIPLITVSYNSPELIDDLIGSFRQFYRNKVYVIDGSDAERYGAIESVCKTYPDVALVHFDYNIHHGPGLAWAYQNLNLSGTVLVLDSDVCILRPGLIEEMLKGLTSDMYGVGSISHVNEDGFDVSEGLDSFRYLHPACMLCNLEVVRKWPMPTKHGAPNIEPMMAIHRAGLYKLICGYDWLAEDFSSSGKPKHFLRHDWQGTVKRTGGYHLEEWQAELAKKHAKTLGSPILTQEGGQANAMEYNRDLLELIPQFARKVIEVGVSNGGLARAYKTANSSCEYIGIEVDRQRAEAARQHCDVVHIMDIEDAEPLFFDAHRDCDAWVFGDVLEHLRDPWRLLAKIRAVISQTGCVVVSLPNTQHWSMQVRLAVGDLRYEDFGLMDRTHLRFFSRSTLLDMFVRAGFNVVAGRPRIFGGLPDGRVGAAIRTLAEVAGVDPEAAIRDSIPLQYVLKAVPSEGMHSPS